MRILCVSRSLWKISFQKPRYLYETKRVKQEGNFPRSLMVMCIWITLVFERPNMGLYSDHFRHNWPGWGVWFLNVNLIFAHYSYRGLHRVSFDCPRHPILWFLENFVCLCFGKVHLQVGIIPLFFLILDEELVMKVLWFKRNVYV